MITLFTIGYQGQNIATMLDTLQSHAVSHLIDVRQRPYGRKPEFNKQRLAASLAVDGIGYSHIVELGTPKPLRDELRRNHDYPAFFATMATLIAAESAALDRVLALVVAKPCVLLCFEAKATECHRSLVAAALAQRLAAPLDIVNL